MGSYPIYILKLGNTDKIVFPEGKEDLGHCDFWEQCVASIVARHYRIPLRKIIDLPYCQRRARVCSDKILFGEALSKTLLARIRKAVEQPELVFVYDEHEKRLAHDVRRFRALKNQFQ
jgi:hypothetical protein